MLTNIWHSYLFWAKILWMSGLGEGSFFIMYAFFRKGIFSSVNPTLWPREETQGRHKKIFLYTFQFYDKIFSFEKKIRVVNPYEKVSTLTPTFLHLSIRLKSRSRCHCPHFFLKFLPVSIKNNCIFVLHNTLTIKILFCYLLFLFVWHYVRRKWKEKVDTLIDVYVLRLGVGVYTEKLVRVATFLYGFKVYKVIRFIRASQAYFFFK